MSCYFKCLVTYITDIRQISLCYSKKSLKIAVGQFCVLQLSNILESPEQGNPPFCGYGSEHVLDREYCPPPHVTEQAP
jgi:hypothetical protein